MAWLIYPLMWRPRIEPSESKSSAAPAHPPATDSVEDLVKRLTAIRERLFWLTTVYATTLSHDVAYEADSYRRIFRELGQRLNAVDSRGIRAARLGPRSAAPV
jgi:hypothetical protein